MLNLTFRLQITYKEAGLATITCRDCGAIRENCPKNTVLCRPCRVIQQLSYELTAQLSGFHTRKDQSKTVSSFAHSKQCYVCDEDHTPYRRDAKMCPKCFSDTHLDYRMTETCPCCRKTPEERNEESGAWPVAVFEDVPICHFCFTSPNPKFRRAIIKYMTEQKYQRAKENNHVVPTKPADSAQG